MIDWDKALLAPVFGVFAEPATYAPAVGQPFPIAGVFDEAYHGVSLAGGTDVPSAMPVIGVRLAQFAAPPKRGDRLTITRTGELFVVKEVEPDGRGQAKLLLNYVGA